MAAFDKDTTSGHLPLAVNSEGLMSLWEFFAILKILNKLFVVSMNINNIISVCILIVDYPYFVYSPIIQYALFICPDHRESGANPS